MLGLLTGYCRGAENDLALEARETAALDGGWFRSNLAKEPSPIDEPFPALNGGAFSGVAVPESPDPLQRYRWSHLNANDDPQCYVLWPIAVTADHAAAFKVERSGEKSQNWAIAVNDAGSLRFDFGVESAAWLEIDSPDLSGDVELSISEYDAPAFIDVVPGHTIKPMTPKRHGKTYRLELCAELYEGVRYGWVHVKTFDKPFHITGVRAVCRVKPTNYNGSFSCSDPLLTSIWYTGAYDVKINFNKDYFGALLMGRGDRYSWTGDAHCAQAAALVAFGNWTSIRENLDRTLGDGGNGIESYVLYWILSFVDYYRYTGDRSVAEIYALGIAEKLDHANSIYDNWMQLTPVASYFGQDEREGANFEDPVNEENMNTYRMMFIRCCRAFAAAMDSIGQTDLRDKYNRIAEQRIAGLRESRRWYNRFGVFACSQAVNADIPTSAEQDEIFHKELADRVTRLAPSPLSEYQIIQAMARMGHCDEALEAVRDYWGGQIRCGATSFFEGYSPEWDLKLVSTSYKLPHSSSLAHAWGGCIAMWLTEQVLGVMPLSPGFATYQILPHLGRTLTRVSGTVPTPYGAISASFDVTTGCFELTAPSGTTGRIGIPKVERRIIAIDADGSRVWDDQFHPVTGIGRAAEDANYVYFTDIQPGPHRFVVQYRGETPSFTPASIHLPPACRKVDSTTSGNWGGVYGRDGFVLFNYDGPNKDRRQLPSYIESVRPSDGSKAYSGCGACRNVQWVASTNDCRAPSPDAVNSTPRNAGALLTQNPFWGGYDFYLDVVAKPGAHFQLTLYFLDWDEKGRRATVNIYDLNTKKLVALPKEVSEFANGKSLVYNCDCPVRVKIGYLGGDNAALSGIFFDPIPQ